MTILDFPYSRALSVTNDCFKVPNCVSGALRTSGHITLLSKRFLLNSFQLFKCCREKNRYGDPLNYKILLTGGRKRHCLPPSILSALSATEEAE